MDQYTNCFRMEGFGVKQTCKQCRSRKVRCDGNRGGCGNCERLGFGCSLASDEADSPDTTMAPSTEIRPPKRRATRACIRCRQQKVRCSGSSPRCSNCQHRNLKCKYAVPKRPLRGQGASDLVTPTQESVNGTSGDHGEWHGQPGEECSCHDTVRTLADEEVKSRPTTTCSGSRLLPLSMVERFFQQSYPLPSYAFIHPATTKARCASATLEKPFALALCGLTILHSRSTGGPLCQCRGFSWIKEAEDLLWQQLERPTISRLHALLLVIKYRMETGHFQRAFMLTGLAARAAVAMRLNHERPELPFLAQEVRRRTMWGLRIAERYFSIGLPEFETCPSEIMHIRRPCSEEEFSGQPLDTTSSPEASDHGSYSILVRLESLRRNVMSLTRSLPNYELPLPHLSQRMEEFDKELAEISSQMIYGTDMSAGRIASLLDNPWLCRHILVHLSWHQTYCDTYRLLLPGFLEAAPTVILEAIDQTEMARAERLCQEHAAAIIQILTGLNLLSTGSHLLEFDTAICAYHATRLLLFISRFGKQPNRYTPEFAVSRADLCLAALKRFFPSSALVKPIIDETDRMMKAFLSHSSAPSGLLASEAASQVPPAKSSPLSSSNDPRQRLAIHSLLRQAEFTDDEDGIEDSSPATAAGGDAGGTGSQATLAAGTGSVDLSSSDTIVAADAGVEDTEPMDQIGLSQASMDMPYGMGLSDEWEFDAVSPELVQFPLFPWYGWQNQDWSFGSAM